MIALLQDAAKNMGHPKLVTVPVPMSVATMWKDLLFSEEFSDIKFKCNGGGVVLHAHKNVLAAASPYFRTAFHGPWREQQSDGVWETSNSSTVMKAVLKFVYTGEVTTRLSTFLVFEAAMLAVAAEYELESLKKIYEEECTLHLDVINVKSMLQLAPLHEAATLKQSCFEYIQRNCAKVLVDPSMMKLATEDVGLWSELVAFISPDGADKERQGQGALKKPRQS